MPLSLFLQNSMSQREVIYSAVHEEAKISKKIWQLNLSIDVELLRLKIAYK